MAKRRAQGDVTPKEFEEMCYEVIAKMDNVKYIAPQGSCQYQHKKKTLYCPDMYGTYQEEPRRWRKGFVIDCKHYHGTSIDEDDCNKLDRDRDEVEKKLKKEKSIGERAVVRSMFVTSEGNGDTARRNGYTVISVGKPGTRGWKTKLEEGFKEAMK